MPAERADEPRVNTDTAHSRDTHLVLVVQCDSLRLGFYAHTHTERKQTVSNAAHRWPANLLFFMLSSKQKELFRLNQCMPEKREKCRSITQ